MNQALGNDQVSQYHRDGYLFPLAVFDREQVAGFLSQMETARSDAENKKLSGVDRYFRANAQLVMPFVCEIAKSPGLIDKVASILGPDLILWSAEFFIKKTKTDKIVSWHQDLTYWGLGDTDEEITAWLALSDVNVASGCMRFVAGSHQQRILPHRDTFDESNLLSRGQEVAVDVDESKAVNVCLKPGEMSFHHGRIFHASGPNQSEQDRIGLAFRFLTPGVRQLVNQRDYALPLRGTDSSGNWIHVTAPTENFDASALKLYAQVKDDQSAALAQGILGDQKMNAAF